MTTDRPIVLVYPRVGSEAPGVSLHPPLPLLYLAAALPGRRVEIYDQRTDPPGRFEELLARDPLCVGFSIFTGYQIGYALELARLARDAGAVTVFGGVHATILPEQTQAHPLVDHVVAGDGEHAFAHLVDTLAAGGAPAPILHARDFPPVELDALGPLPWHLVDVEKYVTVAATSGRTLPFLFSRGCPFACTFCCNPVISNRSWRAMSVDTAAEQLDEMVQRFRLDSIFFTDENLSVNPHLLNDLAGRIAGRFRWFAQARANSLLNYDLNWLARMGASHFGCGLESGSPRILRLIRKQETLEEYVEVNRRLAETNIRVSYNYITGFPTETLDDLRQTIDLALRMLDDNPHADNNTFYLLTPYPGAAVASYLTAEMPASLEGWSDFGRHNYNARWHEPQRMKLYQRIGFSSKFVGRRLTRLFPDHAELAQLAADMTDLWRNFNLEDDATWQGLEQQGWKTLRELFGQHAY